MGQIKNIKLHIVTDIKVLIQLNKGAVMSSGGKKEIAYSGTNECGNSYTRYTDGGYRYHNTNVNSQGEQYTSNYYSPKGGESGFYRSNGSKGTAYYQNSSGERSTLYK